MYYSCRSTYRCINNLLIRIFLSFDSHFWIKSGSTKPKVSIETRIIWLLMDIHPLDVSQKILIKSLNMLVMSKVLVNNFHLSTTNTRTNV